MTDAPFTETHRATLKRRADVATATALGVAIDAALTEIDRLEQQHGAVVVEAATRLAVLREESDRLTASLREVRERKDQRITELVQQLTEARLALGDANAEVTRLTEGEAAWHQHVRDAGEREAHLMREIERLDNLAGVRGNMLRYIAFVTTGDEVGDAQLGVDRLKTRAETAEARIVYLIGEQAQATVAMNAAGVPPEYRHGQRVTVVCERLTEANRVEKARLDEGIAKVLDEVAEHDSWIAREVAERLDASWEAK